MMEKYKTKVYLAITVLLICIALAFFLIWLSYSAPTSPRPIHPTIDLTLEENDDVYKFSVNSSIDPKDALELNKVEIFVNNGSNIQTYSLLEILDNGDYNVTFYDNDNNGRLSVDDEFVIVSNIVKPGTIFGGVFIPYGSSVFNMTIS